MFLGSKAGWAGIALAILTTGVLVPLFPRSPARPASKPGGAATFATKNEIKKMQETLRDKGYFRSQVDGVFGLRTRASIRAYQKAENLPVTGEVDARTADGLGVIPKSTWSAERKVGDGSDGAVGETAKTKPSPYREWARPSRRTSKTPRKEVSRDAAIEDNRGDGANQQQAENEDHE